MFRQSVSFVIALYAIGFAFISMAALRWPSLMVIGAAVADAADPVAHLQGELSWREIGLLYGAPYFLAAICFYGASTQVQRRRRGSLLWFVLGCGLGFPPFLIFDFQPGWWGEPTLFESIMLSAAAFTAFLFFCIWQLRYRAPEEEGPLVLKQAIVSLEDVRQASAPEPSAVPAAKPRIVRRPVPPAIARQRACFAAYGRRQLAKG